MMPHVKKPQKLSGREPGLGFEAPDSISRRLTHPQVPTRQAPGALCACGYCVAVRTTLDISDEAYYLAKAIARDQNRSLGRVVGDLILRSSKGAKGASIRMSDYGFPTFRCSRPVTTDDVKALDDEE
jgi:hypothetical protein